MAMKNKLKFITYCQVIGILLVVLGHSLHCYSPMHGEETLLYKLIYSFHMPLFMFVSGFLLVYTSGILDKDKDMKKPRIFIAKKTKRLLVPFVCLTAVTFLPRSLMSYMADDQIAPTLQNFLMGFVHYKRLPIPFYWYLQAVFALLVVAYCLLWCARKVGIAPFKILFGLFLVFVIINMVDVPTTYFWSLNAVKQLGLYFALGGIYCCQMNNVDRAIDWTSTPVVSGFGAAWVGLYVVNQQFIGGVCSLFCSFCGIATSISVAKIIEAHRWGFLDHLAGATYLIFLLSWYFNIASQQILSHFVALPWWIYSVVSLLSGIYVPWLFNKWLISHRDNRIARILRLILGVK